MYTTHIYIYTNIDVYVCLFQCMCMYVCVCTHIYLAFLRQSFFVEPFDCYVPLANCRSEGSS